MWRRGAELGLLAMEAVFLFLVAAALTAFVSGDAPSYLTVLAGVLGGFLMVRLLLRFDVGITVQVIAGAAITVVYLWTLLSLQYDPGAAPFALGWLTGLARDPDRFFSSNWPAIYGGGAVIAGWFRGVYLGQRDITYRHVLSSFSVGLVLVALLLLTGQQSRAAGAIDSAALPYFILGLLTLSLVHLRTAEDQGGGVKQGPWLATLAVTVGGLALASAVIGLFPLDALNRLLAPVGRLALRGLDLLILVMALPLYYLFEFIIQLLLGDREAGIPPPSRPASNLAEEVQRQADRGGFIEFLFTLGRGLFLVALLALAGYVLWRVFRQLSRPSDQGELRESIAPDGSLGDDLSALLAGLRGRFRRGPAPTPEPALSPVGLRVRRLYLRALRRAEEQGAPRPLPATVHEFAPRMEEALATPAAGTLSEWFAAARYGGVDPEVPVVERLEREIDRKGG